MCEYTGSLNIPNALSSIVGGHTSPVTPLQLQTSPMHALTDLLDVLCTNLVQQIYQNPSRHQQHTHLGYTQ